VSFSLLTHHVLLLLSPPFLLSIATLKQAAQDSNVMLGALSTSVTTKPINGTIFIFNLSVGSEDWGSIRIPSARPH
jgi:hypothetical protein